MGAAEIASEALPPRQRTEIRAITPDGANPQATYESRAVARGNSIDVAKYGMMDLNTAKSSVLAPRPSTRSGQDPWTFPGALYAACVCVLGANAHRDT